MAIHPRSLPVFLAPFLIGLSFSAASVVNLRKYNSVLHQVEDRVRSPEGPGRQGPPGDHGPLVGPGGPPGGNDTSGMIFGPGGPGGPGFPPVAPTGEKCVSMCEKLEALIDSLEANITQSNVTAGNATDPDIPPVMFFVILLCSNSTADGPLNQTHPGKIGDSSEETGESEESSEESSEEGDSAESSEEEGDDNDETDRWISWDRLEARHRGRPGHFHKVCKAHERLMNLQSIRQTMDNATHFNQSGPLQPLLDYIHDVCQNGSDVGDGDGDGDSRMIRKGPQQHSGKGAKFDNWDGPPGHMGDPIAEFCEVVSIVLQPMGGGNFTAPGGSAEVMAFFKDMVSCLCNIDLNK